MGKATKTDNHDPAAKLELRRYFLRKYHADDLANILDCCQGSGRLWQHLRREFDLAGYWGLDLKPKKGRLKLDSVRVLAQPGWPQNVIDVDTYGSPWKGWFALLPNVVRPLTVFVTRGFHSREEPDGYERRASGLTLKATDLSAFFPKLQMSDYFITSCLSMCCEFGILIKEAVEAVSTGNARYVGVRLEKASDRKGGNPRGRSRRNDPVKEDRHV